MGSDRKSKEKQKSRKRSSSPDSEDERRSKKHRSDRKDKGKEKKSHKHRSDKEKKSRDKHRDKYHKGHHLKHEFQELTSDDYFSKNNEFATWLKEEKKVFFSDLSSESAREYFSDFVKAWNKQKLDSRYYEGISSGPRSAHNWKFK
ncbi:putative Pentatricopeptide repeat-containing protein [Melia azedarach]|uniref:Pentatricopeptide repeat-containing protein n=1 Tax=Melia azedarach TaxID=155640 RepID=A0ACC1X3C8_MELAZ|nr:putative Pentatricopeptide repeat-containing protein [Melia azedarach]